MSQYKSSPESINSSEISQGTQSGPDLLRKKPYPPRNPLSKMHFYLCLTNKMINIIICENFSLETEANAHTSSTSTRWS